jgi:hypothetical protein
MQQDFNNKISVVIDKGLPTWQAMNALAHISANFGKYLESIGKFDTGATFETLDKVGIPRNTQYAIIVFETDHDTLQQFAHESRSFENVKQMYFIREMIETSKDEEISTSVASKNFEDVDFLGVGLYGENALLKSFTKRFKLWS